MGSQGIHRLKALTISRPLKRGYYADGGGLYLQVGTTGSKSWVYRYRSKGRLREQGLGSAKSISLADARLSAMEARKLVANGQDPIAYRREKQAAARLEAARPDKTSILWRVMTFKEFNERNDPYGEHDFGAFEQGPDTVFWKIDYYNPALTAGSENPADSKLTVRVLTIMLAEEY